MIFKFQSYNVQARIEPNLDWIDGDDWFDYSFKNLAVDD